MPRDYIFFVALFFRDCYTNIRINVPKIDDRMSYGGKNDRFKTKYSIY